MVVSCSKFESAKNNHDRVHRFVLVKYQLFDNSGLYQFTIIYQESILRSTVRKLVEDILILGMWHFFRLFVEGRHIFPSSLNNIRRSSRQYEST